MRWGSLHASTAFYGLASRYLSKPIMNILVAMLTLKSEMLRYISRVCVREGFKKKTVKKRSG